MLDASSPFPFPPSPPNVVPEAPPVDLAAFSPTSTSIQVSWGLVPPVCRNGLILEYEVVYTVVPASGPGSMMTASVLTSSNSTVLTNLRKFVVYSLCVQARTSIPVFGNCSVPVVVRTLNDSRSPVLPLHSTHFPPLSLRSG